MKAYFLGYDLGSHASKGVITDSSGRIISSCSRVHGIDIPPGGGQEHDSAMLWQEFCDILKQLLSVSGIDSSSIKAAGITGYVPGLAAVDLEGAPVRPVIMHTDLRADAQLESLKKSSGLAVHHGNLLPKLLWIRENEPEAYRQIWKILVPHSYLAFRLTGSATCDIDTASIFGGIYREKDNCWDGDVLETLNIDINIFPALHDTDSVIGYVSGPASKQTGLPEKLPVIAGTGDSFSAMLGCGAVKKHDLMIYLGTSATQIIMGGNPDSIISGIHFGENRAVFAGRIVSCGESMENFRRILGFENWKDLDLKGAEISPGADGLLVLPHLKQQSDSSAEGAGLESIIGLHSRHTAFHIYRALLEGIAFNMIMQSEQYKDNSGRIILSGGAAGSQVFREIISNVFGKPVMYNPESSGAAGISFLAAHAYGNIDYRQMSSRYTEDAQIILPEEEKIQTYRDLYGRYKNAASDMGRLYLKLKENK